MVWEIWVMKMVLEVCGHSKKLYETSASYPPDFARQVARLERDVDDNDECLINIGAISSG